MFSVMNILHLRFSNNPATNDVNQFSRLLDLGPTIYYIMKLNSFKRGNIFI